MPARASRLLYQLPKTSRVFIAIEPANQWGWKEVLLNKIEYAMQVIAWQNANEGKKVSQQSEKPTLFKPPFMPEKPADPDSAAVDIEDAKALLARPRV